MIAGIDSLAVADMIRQNTHPEGQTNAAAFFINCQLSIPAMFKLF